MSRNPVRRAVAWRRRRSSARLGRYAPHLLPVWVAAPLALLVAGLAAALIYRRVRDAAGLAPDTLDLVRTTITVAGFAGAVLAGVYAYRKQRLAEGDARRADAERLAARYTAAAEQLGHEKAAVRLAGVYAMARLADDWPEQRQVCVDVLCAYLRMPYDPDQSSPKHREGEREVRLTIIRVVRDHLRDPVSPTTWCGRDLDFTGATFEECDFSGSYFNGGRTSFRGARFVGGLMNFYPNHVQQRSGGVRLRDLRRQLRGLLVREVPRWSGRLQVREVHWRGHRVRRCDVVEWVVEHRQRNLHGLQRKVGPVPPKDRGTEYPR